MDGTTKDDETYIAKNIRAPWYKYITVEPTMFLYMMAFMITNVVEQTFYVFRACNVNHGYSPEICYNITAYPDVNTEVQVTVSTFLQWNGIATHIVPLILAFFLGSYSDKRGRKTVILAGLIGKLYFSIMITVNSLKDWPLEYMIYTAAFPSALTGADLAIFAGAFAYIADVSSLNNRTLRVGILDVVYLSTMSSGVAIGNVLYTKVVDRSFPIMFAINTSLMTIATVYSFFCLKWQTRPEQKSLREADERPVMYLYVQNVFQWDLAAYSNFRTYNSTAYVLLMLFGIPLMSKVLRWKDTFIVMLGAASHMTGHFLYAQATSWKLLYVGATAAALGPCVAPLVRSMTSKVLPPAERGVAYAFLSVMENLVAMFASIIYSQVYKATLNTDHLNAFFYLTMGTQAVVFLLAFIMEIMLRGRTLESLVSHEEEGISERISERSS
ncbi:hypothetical protein MSG28_001049 [Choristoneura fumiferana]|uniref:Uncharacterized protein n=1 Tax=Choristoneura fumiferana TaxID=7141 RepID=A0ACC0K3H0_CHOFU|nr:hypothetical protein MSG28_001049 [Choristoneura fumiferana]